MTQIDGFSMKITTTAPDSGQSEQRPQTPTQDGFPPVNPHAQLVLRTPGALENIEHPEAEGANEESEADVEVPADPQPEVAQRRSRRLRNRIRQALRNLVPYFRWQLRRARNIWQVLIEFILEVASMIIKLGYSAWACGSVGLYAFRRGIEPAIHAHNVTTASAVDGAIIVALITLVGTHLQSALISWFNRAFEAQLPQPVPTDNNSTDEDRQVFLAMRADILRYRLQHLLVWIAPGLLWIVARILT